MISQDYKNRKKALIIFIAYIAIVLSLTFLLLINSPSYNKLNDNTGLTMGKVMKTYKTSIGSGASFYESEIIAFVGNRKYIFLERYPPYLVVGKYYYVCYKKELPCSMCILKNMDIPEVATDDELKVYFKSNNLNEQDFNDKGIYYEYSTFRHLLFMFCKLLHIDYEGCDCNLQ